jgi:hypothetical protein
MAEARAMSQGTTSPKPGVVSDDQVRLRLKGLQHEVERTATLARWMSWLAILLVALLIALAISIYLYHVMQYASVTTVDAFAVPGRPGTARIDFEPASSGKIEFVKESDGVVETLTEYATVPSDGDSTKNFTWSGNDDKKLTLQVTYRSGLFLVTKDLPLTKASSKN